MAFRANLAVNYASAINAAGALHRSGRDVADVLSRWVAAGCSARTQAEALQITVTTSCDELCGLTARRVEEMGRATMQLLATLPDDANFTFEPEVSLVDHLEQLSSHGHPIDRSNKAKYVAAAGGIAAKKLFRAQGGGQDWEFGRRRSGGGMDGGGAG